MNYKDFLLENLEKEEILLEAKRGSKPKKYTDLEVTNAVNALKNFGINHPTQGDIRGYLSKDNVIIAGLKERGQQNKQKQEQQNQEKEEKRKKQEQQNQEKEEKRKKQEAEEKKKPKQWSNMTKSEKQKFGKKAAIGGAALGVAAIGANYIAKKMNGEETAIDKLKKKIKQSKEKNELNESYIYLYENFSEINTEILNNLTEEDYRVLNILAEMDLES